MSLRLSRILQLTDSFYPTGSYAHSFGLEGLVQAGMVTDPASLESWIRNTVVPSLANAEAPFVRAAHEAAMAADKTRLHQLDQMYGAMKGSRELREASRRIGRQRLEMATRIAPNDWKMKPKVEHAAIVCGIECARAGSSADEAVQVFAYQALASLLSAAIKLLRLGQNFIQPMLARALDQLGATASPVSVEDAGWFNPQLDIASARHERAFAREFIS